MTGKLVLVGTPIGNLGDISQRAVEALQAADLILCEDTRHSARLLNRYRIRVSTESYGAHNIRSRLPWIFKQLQAGKCLAYISDAGMPGISDPGAALVRRAVDENIHVEIVPGPSAVLTALVLSGLPTDRFVFEGFLPHKKGRQSGLKRLAEEPRTIVLYESPHRLLKTLGELQEHLGDRQAAVARELTKLHEEVLRDRLSVLTAHFEQHKPRGEFVIVVAGTGYRER